MKDALLAAAERSGRSLSQEVELRIHQSLESEGHLILTRGGEAWAPAFFEGRELRLLLGDESPADVIVLRVNAADVQRLRGYFKMKEDPGAG
jgi:hypothetical protein